MSTHDVGVVRSHNLRGRKGPPCLSSKYAFGNLFFKIEAYEASEKPKRERGHFPVALVLWIPAGRFLCLSALYLFEPTQLSLSCSVKIAEDFYLTLTGILRCPQKRTFYNRSNVSIEERIFIMIGLIFLKSEPENSAPCSNAQFRRTAEVKKDARSPSDVPFQKR